MCGEQRVEGNAGVAGQCAVGPPLALPGVNSRRDWPWSHFSCCVERARRLAGAAIRLAIVLFIAGSSGGQAATPSLGRPGEPIRLVVGFNPYFAPAWTLAILEGKALWKKYLPAGSRVDLEIGVRGPAIAGALAAGQIHLAYFADAAVALAASGRPDVRLIAVTSMSQDLCVIVARADAPPFPDAQAGARWLAGKRIATTPGTCQGRVTQLVLDRERIEPGQLLNLGRESLEQAFREGRIDAAGVPEPGASDLVMRGQARMLASPRAYGEWDASFIAASADFLRARPDIVTGWLHAELDAQLFMSDPSNAAEVVRLIAQRARLLPEKAVRAAFYGDHRKAQGGAAARIVFPFVFNADAMEVVRKIHVYLQQRGLAGSGALRSEAVESGLAERVLAARKLRHPVGAVRAVAAPGG